MHSRLVGKNAFPKKGDIALVSKFNYKTLKPEIYAIDQMHERLLAKHEGEEGRVNRSNQMKNLQVLLDQMG
jgi:hypothetical protein